MANGYYLGIDPAGVTGWAMTTGQGGEWRLSSVPWTKRPLDASMQLRERLAGVVTTGCMGVACEHPTSQSRGIAHAYGWLVCTVSVYCADQAVPCVAIKPKAWKRMVLGNGNADKATVIEWARSGGHAPISDNHADAIALAEYARAGHK